MHLSLVEWAFLGTGVFLVGFAKTAVTSTGALAVVVFVLVLPARESTGALLPLLCCGDLIALALYRRHANWKILIRMFLGVVPGLLSGAWFVDSVDNQTMRKAIGLALLIVVAAYVLARRMRRSSDPGPRAHGPVLRHHGVTATTGVIAGFTTMTANAGGPVTSLYLLSARVSMLEFLGTAAWFFFVVNLAKLPLSASLGLVSGQSLVMDALLLPLLIAGAATGAVVISKIDQDKFDRAAVLLTAVAACLLIAF